jgi:hypothetical protein
MIPAIVFKVSCLPVSSLSFLWSLTLRDEHRLRVSENRVLRRIFRAKREEVAGGWRRLHDMKNAHNNLVGRSQ